MYSIYSKHFGVDKNFKFVSTYTFKLWTMNNRNYYYNIFVLLMYLKIPRLCLFTAFRIYCLSIMQMMTDIENIIKRSQLDWNLYIYISKKVWLLTSTIFIWLSIVLQRVLMAQSIIETLYLKMSQLLRWPDNDFPNYKILTLLLTRWFLMKACSFIDIVTIEFKGND